MDRLLRELERRAEAGDPEASEQLALVRRRRVEVTQLLDLVASEPGWLAEAIVKHLTRDQVQRFLHGLQARFAPRSSFEPPLPLDHIRSRVGMYIGDVYQPGLHRLVWEVVALSCSDVREGRCRDVRVELCPDGSAQICDDGHTSLVEVDPTTGRPSVDRAGFSAYGRYLGLGLGVVAALSARLEVDCVQSGELIRARFTQGEPDGLADPLGPAGGPARRIRIWPDPAVFHPGTEFDAGQIAQRLRALAALMPRATFELRTPDRPEAEVFASPEGLAALLPLNEAVGPPLSFEAERYSAESGGLVRISLALAYGPPGPEQVWSFCNDEETPEHGVHWTGVAAALTSSCNAWSRAHLGAQHRAIAGEVCRDGLLLAIAVWLPEPQFRGSIRQCLGNAELPAIVRELAEPGLRAWLDSDNAATKRLLDRARG